MAASATCSSARLLAIIGCLAAHIASSHGAPLTPGAIERTASSMPAPSDPDVAPLSERLNASPRTSSTSNTTGIEDTLLAAPQMPEVTVKAKEKQRAAQREGPVALHKEHRPQTVKLKRRKRRSPAQTPGRARRFDGEEASWGKPNSCDDSCDYLGFSCNGGCETPGSDPNLNHNPTTSPNNHEEATWGKPNSCDHSCDYLGWSCDGGCETPLSDPNLNHNPTTSPNNQAAPKPVPSLVDVDGTAYNPSNHKPGANGANGLLECHGDCNSDSDCLGTRKCFQRSGNEPVPGCASFGSGDKSGYDFCYYDLCSIELSSNHPSEDTSAGACISGLSSVDECQVHCANLEKCTAYWFYTGGALKGKCSPKATYATSYTRKVANGAFFRPC